MFALNNNVRLSPDSLATYFPLLIPGALHTPFGMASNSSAVSHKSNTMSTGKEVIPDLSGCTDNLKFEVCNSLDEHNCSTDDSNETHLSLKILLATFCTGLGSF